MVFNFLDFVQMPEFSLSARYFRFVKTEHFIHLYSWRVFHAPAKEGYILQIKVDLAGVQGTVGNVHIFVFFDRWARHVNRKC